MAFNSSTVCLAEGLEGAGDCVWWAKEREWKSNYEVSNCGDRASIIEQHCSTSTLCLLSYQIIISVFEDASSSIQIFSSRELTLGVVKFQLTVSVTICSCRVITVSLIFKAV